MSGTCRRPRAPRRRAQPKVGGGAATKSRCSWSRYCSDGAMGSISASAVRAIAPGRAGERHVIVAVAFVNAEPQRHAIEKWRIGERQALRAEVIGDVKDEL